MVEEEFSKPVQRLLQQGICSIEDVREAVEEARKLLLPDMSDRIRRAERVMSVLGDSTRIRILLLLSTREMCVCEIEAALQLTQSTASHHLGLLEHAGILTRNRKSKRVFYQLNKTQLIDEVLRETREGGIESVT